MAYYQKGFYREAIIAYKEFLESKPDYENAHNSLGLAYQGLKQWDNAIQEFFEELRYHPDHVYVHVYLGDIYMKMRKYSKALFHYKKALKYPNLSDAEKIRKTVSAIERGK
jgi:tetratricopeptide (TPR) repeat protein